MNLLFHAVFLLFSLNACVLVAQDSIVDESAGVAVVQDDDDDEFIDLPTDTTDEEDIEKGKNIPDDNLESEVTKKGGDEYDPDEFDLGEDGNNRTKLKNQTKEIPIVYTWDTLHRNPALPFFERFFFEIVIGIFFLVYLINFYTGKKVNLELAKAWTIFHLNWFQEQFTFIGAGKKVEGSNETPKPLEQKSYNAFHFYASGRVNCLYTLVSFEMKRRQDLFTMLVTNVIFPERDRISFEIPLDYADPFMCVFGMCKKKDTKKILENYADLKNLTKPRTLPEIPDTYQIFAEYDEIVPYILSPTFIKLLQNFEKNIVMVHVTDQKVFSAHTLALRIDLEVPSKPDDMETMLKVTKGIFNVVDHLANFKMTATAKASAQKNRNKLMSKNFKEEKHAEIAEKIQKKKVDDKKQKDKKISELKGDAQKKAEAREYKKEMKKRSKKLTKFVKV